MARLRQLDSSEPGSPNGTVGSAAIGKFSVLSLAGNGYLNDGGLRGRNGTAPGWPMTGRGALSWSLRSTSSWADNRDFDAAATGNATWAPALRAANLRYARQFQSLEYIQQSALGKMLGKNVVDADLTGLQATTKPPEALARKLLTMDPSQVRTTAAILQRGSPEVLQGAKAFILRDALHRSVDQVAGGGSQLNFAKFQKNIAQLAPQINGLGFSTAERNQIKDIIDTMATVGKQAKPKGGLNTADMAEGAVALAGHGLAAARSHLPAEVFAIGS